MRLTDAVAEDWADYLPVVDSLVETDWADGCIASHLSSADLCGGVSGQAYWVKLQMLFSEHWLKFRRVYWYLELIEIIWLQGLGLTLELY